MHRCNGPRQAWGTSGRVVGSASSRSRAEARTEAETEAVGVKGCRRARGRKQRVGRSNVDVWGRFKSKEKEVCRKKKRKEKSSMVVRRSQVQGHEHE